MNLLSVAFPQGLFDAATKVTSWWALGAFGIAAAVAIVLGNKSKSARARFPPAAVVVIVFAIIVPVAGAVILGLNPDVPFRVTITVVDEAGSVVNTPHVTCGAGIQPSTIGAVALFEIPVTDIPANRKISFYADNGTNSGEEVVEFGRTRSIAVKIQLRANQSGTSEPETRKQKEIPPADPPKAAWCDHGPSGDVYQFNYPFDPDEHLNGRTVATDFGPSPEWYVEWKAPGPVYKVDVTYQATLKVDAENCGPVPGRDTFAFCQGWKNGDKHYELVMHSYWKQPCQP